MSQIHTEGTSSHIIYLELQYPEFLYDYGPEGSRNWQRNNSASLSTSPMIWRYNNRTNVRENEDDERLSVYCH